MGVSIEFEVGNRSEGWQAAELNLSPSARAGSSTPVLLLAATTGGGAPFFFFYVPIVDCVVVGTSWL